MNTPPFTYRSLQALSVLACSVSASLFGQSSSPSPDKEIIILSPFSVLAAPDDGYRMDSATVASRSNKKLIDIPQTVNVLTSEFLKDTFSFNQDDAIKYVSNASVRNTSVASLDPGMYILRGFENRNAYVEGVLGPAYRRDLVGYDRMEVIKGVPSAVLGRADASGAMNFVLKKPVLNKTFTELRAIVGNNSFYRFEADHNLSLSKDVGARLVVAAEDSNVFVHEPNDQRFYRFFPSIRFKPSDKTELNVNAEVLSTKSMIAAYGQGFTIMPAKFRRLFPATIGRDTDPITALNLPWDFYLSPSELQENVANVMATFTHRFSDHVDFRQIVSYISFTQEQEFYNSGGNLPDTNPFDPTNANGLYKALLYDLNKIAEWRWNAVGDVLVRYGWNKAPLDLKFSTMAGYSLTARQQENIGRRYPIVGAARFINLRNPQFLPVGANAPLDRVTVGQLTNTLTQSETFSYYIQQEVSAWKERISLVYGWRDTRAQGSLANYLNTTTPKTETDSHPPASTRFGGTFKVRNNLSLFASRSEQIDPAETTLVWGRLNAGDPRSLETIVGDPSTKSTEFGVKGTLFSDRLYYSLAYFKLARTGTVDNESINVDSPVGSGQTVLATRRSLTNGDTSKGWEVELIGQVTKNLTVLASGSINDTAQPNVTTVLPGDVRPMRFVPDWSTNLFAKYSFHSGRIDGFSVRAGTNIIGPIPSSEVSNFGRQPLDKVQKRIDVGTSYVWASGRYKADFQISNLLNETFFIVRVNNPREYRLSLAAKF